MSIGHPNTQGLANSQLSLRGAQILQLRELVSVTDSERWFVLGSARSRFRWYRRILLSCDRRLIKCDFGFQNAGMFYSGCFTEEVVLNSQQPHVMRVLKSTERVDLDF
jgi:hypothetical protein